MHSATSGDEEVLRIEVRVGADIGCGGNELGVLEGKVGRGGSENGYENGSKHARAVWGFVPIQRGIEESGIHLVPSLLAVLDKGREECKVEGRVRERCGASSADKGEVGARSGV